MTADQSIQEKYCALIKAHVAMPKEKHLAAAAELGRELARAAVPEEKVAEIHAEATRCVAQEFPDMALQDAAPLIWAPLTKMLMAYGLAFRKQAEEEIERQAAFPGQNPNPVLRIGRDGRISYVNESSLNLLSAWGCARGDPLPDRFRQLALDVVASGTSEEVEVTYGSATYSLTFVPAADGRYIHIYGLDITGRKNLEEQLRQAAKMEAVGQLAGGVAHDFSNLLTGISGFAQLVLEQAGHDSAFKPDLIQIRELADHAASLTRQLLTFSRRQPIEPVVLNINALVENTSKMLRRLIGEDIDLEFIAAPDLGNVRADPDQIEQVLVNLAVNARDAMPRGGKLTIETVNVTLDREYANGRVEVTPGPCVMLAISDTGCGMDEATRQRIFEPFFTTKESGRGTGLGLSIAYGVVKQHGGSLWVYSEPGKGTTFKIYLPRVNGDAKHCPRAGERNAATLPGSETILVAEDEEVVRAIVHRALQTLGYTALSAASPVEAEEIFAQREGDVALLLADVVMPVMNGCELYERLAAARPDLKVLYMSGYTENAVVRNGVLEPGTPYLQKPFTPDALAWKVREVLDG